MTSTSLARFQACPRRFALEQQYRYLRRRPKQVLDEVLVDAIYNISNGGDPDAEADEATSKLVELAARPGFDFLGDPYTLAQDLCAIIRNVCEMLSRTVMLSLRKRGTIQVGDTPWTFTSFVDDSGTLQRWMTVDKWTEDAKYRAIHSWQVFGDCAAAEQGMQLHVIEIGQHRKGHQHTDWCRAYRHPMIPTKFRFRKLDGTKLETTWKPVWFQSSPKNNAKTWVDLMQADNLNPIVHLDIAPPDRKTIDNFKRDIQMEYRKMQEISDWRTIPMHRSACDVPFICPWQNVCYGQSDNPEAYGGYVKIISA